MKDYHSIEDKIIYFLNDFKYDEKNKKLSDLVEIFNIYWKQYQDKWLTNYWDIYNSTDQSNNNREKFEISNILETLHTEDNTYMETNFNKNSETNENILLTRENTKFSLSSHQSKILINLDEIDEELENIKDVSIFKDKKPEKNRNCLDCTIF